MSICTYAVDVFVAGMFICMMRYYDCLFVRFMIVFMYMSIIWQAVDASWFDLFAK